MLQIFFVKNYWSGPRYLQNVFFSFFVKVCDKYLYLDTLCTYSQMRSGIPLFSAALDTEPRLRQISDAYGVIPRSHLREYSLVKMGNRFFRKTIAGQTACDPLCAACAAPSACGAGLSA